MSINAAGEEKLGELHLLVAETLVEQLKAEELDPRVISSAITFLNNNHITHNPFLDEKMTEIQEALKNRKKRFTAVDPDEAAERAASNS